MGGMNKTIFGEEHREEEETCMDQLGMRRGRCKNHRPYSFLEPTDLLLYSELGHLYLGPKHVLGEWASQVEGRNLLVYYSII